MNLFLVPTRYTQYSNCQKHCDLFADNIAVKSLETVEPRPAKLVKSANQASMIESDGRS